MNRVEGSRGLQPYRILIYSMIFVLALFSAVIPFTTRGGHAYTETPAFCWLPEFPRWYRLALSYCPRVAISLTIMALSWITIIRVWLCLRASRSTKFDISNSWLDGTQPCSMEGRSQDFGDAQDDLSSATLSPALEARTAPTCDLTHRQSPVVSMRNANPSTRLHEKRLLAKLSQLLVYPSIYAILWLAPLVSVVRTYMGKPSDILFGFTVVCRCSMGFVNALCFFLIETPNRED